MKKIIALACMITFIFGFTACGSEAEYTEYEQTKMHNAEQIAQHVAMPYLISFMDESRANYFDPYTANEIKQIVAEEVSNAYMGAISLNVDGEAMRGAVISFSSALEAIGTVSEDGIGTAEAEIDGKTIIVKIPVTGSKEKAEAELIFSNDMFYILESAALNEEATMGDLMTKAGLNTLIGMGTVFLVLILISLIIGAFGFIPKIQAWAANRNKKDETKIESIDNTIAQIVEKEEDVTDDLELVAVIAAAIAASEGQTSTDGFVVRSIRKVNRRR